MSKTQIKSKKAFALSSIIRAILIRSHNGNPKLTALKVQINKAMKNFSMKVGKESYLISVNIQHICAREAKLCDDILDENEIEVFLEMMLSLMNKTDIKSFLKINFSTIHKLHDEKKSEILMAVLELDKELNKMFGTKPTATRESLDHVMVKPVKHKYVKTKRTKAKPKALKMIQKRAKWNRDRLRNS